jgi:RNA polymerase sigma-70 factor (ECF subfamily)
MKTLRRLRNGKNPAPHETDDLVQDTLLKLCANNFRALHSFDCQHENALFGFLKVVASNVVQDHFRSSHSQKRGSGREEEELDPACDGHVDVSAERNILIGEIHRCLESEASERDCMIFWLYYQQGLTAKAISELPAIGLTVKGVESTLLRLTRLVREKMNAKPDKSGTSGQAGASSHSAASCG